MMALSAIGWLALVTWSKPGSALAIREGSQAYLLITSAGSVAADFLWQTQGFAALLVFLAPSVWGWQLVTRPRIARFTTKLLLYFASIVFMAGALSALPTLSAWPLHHGFGGMLGDVLFRFGADFLATIAADRATMLTGLIFLVAGSSCALASMGLGYGDVAELIKRPNRGTGDTAKGTGWFPALTRRRAGERADDHALAQNGAGPGSDGPSFEQGAPLPGQGDFSSEPTGDPSSRQIARRFAPHRGEVPLQYSQDRPVVPAGPRPLHGLPADPYGPAGAPAYPNGMHAPPPRAPNPENYAPRPPAPHPTRPPAPALRAGRPPSTYTTPSLSILKRPPPGKSSPEFTKTALRQNASMLETVLADFSVKGQIRDIKPGPVVTLFEFEPARGVKSSRVIGLADDIARNMSAVSVRVAVVPGRNVIGIELPNVRRETVYLRDLLENEPFRSAGGTLPLALGKSIGGEPVIADLARMPHLLVAGTTGSGKSVGVNAMILSLLYKLSPETCRFIMIDPKMLELSVYNGIPHLLCPVVTNPQKAVAALNWVVREMEERYQRMAKLGVRNIEAYNHRIVAARDKGEQLVRVVQTGFDPATGAPRYERETLAFEPIPFIVVVVDEFADLMMVAGKEIEGAIQRLAQMARAAGIHLIMATQRPSVDVITGTIKANFPTRISFKVTSKVDSRTILNEQGAEQLLGSGDMLYSGGSGQITRVHGPFVSDGEVEAVVQALRQNGPPRYIEGITDIPEPEEEASIDTVDDLYERAVEIVAKDRKASTSYIQRRLAIGYNRAADIIERLETAGIIGPADATGRRDVLIPLPGEQQQQAWSPPGQPQTPQRRPLPRSVARQPGGKKASPDVEPRTPRARSTPRNQD